MKPLISIIFLLFSACTTLPLRKTYVDVTPEQFQALYDIPQTYWKLPTQFRETRNYFMIDAFAWRMKSWPEYDRSWRISKSKMPDDFPQDARIVFTEAALTDEEKDLLFDRVKKARNLGIDFPDNRLFISPYTLDPGILYPIPVILTDPDARVTLTTYRDEFSLSKQNPYNIRLERMWSEPTLNQESTFLQRFRRP
jgi:hypothetical protein